jgi:hypothetical protein
MTNGVIRAELAVGGCPTRDNPPAGAPELDNLFLLVNRN